MFGLGIQELLMILVVALVIIGPKKLPDLARALGRAMREFRSATDDIKQSFTMDPLNMDTPSAIKQAHKPQPQPAKDPGKNQSDQKEESEKKE